MKKYMHPLLLIVGLAACGLLLHLFLTGLWGIALSLTYVPGELGDEIMARRLPHNWPFIIAKTFWMTGFSAGVIGFTLSILKLLKLRRIKKTPYKYGSLKDLTEDEFNKLKAILESSDSDMEDLRRVW